jgi:gamma-glutamylaminecyclotransferase
MAQSVTNGLPRVFVYGTLKKGYGNHRLLSGATCIGATQVEGPHRMVDLGYFPGAVRVDLERGPGVLRGEVYEVTTEILGSLDLLEGHPNFYERAKIDTEHGKAWCYFLPQQYLDEYPLIESGEWGSSAENV